MVSIGPEHVRVSFDFSTNNFRPRNKTAMVQLSRMAA